MTDANQMTREEKLLTYPFLGEIFVFIVCFFYWGYLFFSTEMYIVFDSIGYHDVGELIFKQGWIEFFKTGLHREPLYYCFIALSMKIGEIFSISYLSILKLLQILTLFFTQLFLLYVLATLKIKKEVRLLTVLYLGVSPALINSAFSMFSEIAVLPFILLFIICACKIIDSWIEEKRGKSIVFSVLAAFVTIFAVMGKGMFIYVFYLFFPGVIIFLLLCLYKKQFNNALTVLMSGLLLFSIVFSFLHLYKRLNKKYNGYYKLSCADVSIFLGSAYKRADELTLKKIGAYIASVPGTGVCNLFFTKQECDYCDWYGSDSYRVKFLDWVYKNYPSDQIDEITVKKAFEKIRRHPVKYVFLTTIEIFKMPFWESTRVGYVGYPAKLERLYSWKPFRYGIRLGIALITIASFLGMIIFVFQRRKIFMAMGSEGRAERLYFLTLLVILIYSAIYAACYVITRYAFPIVPLYLLLVAGFFDCLAKNNFFPRGFKYFKSINSYYFIVISLYILWRAKVFLER